MANTPTGITATGPQKHIGQRQDAKTSRPDGKAGGDAQGNPLDSKQRPCKRAKCTVWFTPRRSTQEYHAETCRKLAYLDRLHDGMVLVLEEVIAAPQGCKCYSREKMYERLEQLAEHASTALAEFKKK